jgi:hypothetical protein
MKDDDWNNLGCIVLGAVLILAIAAYEIAKLFVAKMP